MPRYSRPSYTSIGYPPWTRGVKIIVIACVLAFLLQIISEVFISDSLITDLFGLSASDVLRGYLWQPVTYIFLHDTRAILHILFNMLGLWMFGSDLEQFWGTRRFIRFFFVCGIGAGILFTALSLVTGTANARAIGASGAVYGVLLAFGVLFPDRIIYWLIFPIPARYFVMIMGGIALFSSVMARNSGIAHVAHVGGMICGYLYLRYSGMLRGGGGRGTIRGLRARYEEWRRARLRRKFEVYYNDRHRNDNDDKWRRWKN